MQLLPPAQCPYWFGGSTTLTVFGCLPRHRSTNLPPVSTSSPAASRQAASSLVDWCRHRWRRQPDQRREKKKEEERRSISHSVFPFDSGLGRQPKLNGPASGQQMAPCQLPFSALASQPIVKRNSKKKKTCYCFKSLKKQNNNQSKS